MADKTIISDVIVPSVFQQYVIQRTAELSALFSSGIVQRTSEFDALASGPGKTVNMPFWNDLTGEDEVLSDTSALTPGKIVAAQDVAVKLMRGRAWSTNDLAGELAGDDPMSAIGDLVAEYWARRYQAALIEMLNGIFSATSMLGLVHNISGETGNKIDGKTFLDAVQKLGDAKTKLTAVLMHSAVENYLAQNDLIESLKESEGAPELRTFMGKTVIVDDALVANEGVYPTYIFGFGAFAYGEGAPDNPVEVGRDVLAGDDILVNRRHFILHPRGVMWKGTAASSSPSNIELAVGTNWQRVYEVKNIRIVKFLHKIA